MAKLVALGDSLTQGFQSGAIFNTEWSFPALIARAMLLPLPDGFRFPRFPGSGLPLNIEAMLRSMATELGPDISGEEWLVRFPLLLNRFVDEVEDLYERGSGAAPAPFGGVYHNLAVWGFRVADAYTVTSKYADKVIAKQEGWLADDLLGVPSAAMYRTARRVLNPRRQQERQAWSMLDNLAQIVREDPGGVENLILWLGANDCLGTVLDLELRPMPSAGTPEDPEERRRWNLTHPDVFARDFATLLERVRAIVPATTRVFVGTIPHVTIPPVTQGIPPFDGTYFAYYGRFFANQQNFSPSLNQHLTGAQAQLIDAVIDSYNRTIADLVAAQGPAWRLVDMCDVLDQLAVKRNNLTDAPDRALREYYARLGLRTHPLLDLDPVPNVLRLTTEELGRRVKGGLFSLDCFHPTTIGYGIVAEAFMREMAAAGVAEADPARLNWQEIIAHDTLLRLPPVLWDDIAEAAEHNALLWELIFRVIA
jgi:hypothetical protein